MPDDFHDQLISALPRLRAQAWAMARNRTEAEDLLQDAVTNALRARDSFTPGTNFPAWLHRILRNRFISLLRKRRETVEFEDLSFGPGTAATQEDCLTLKALYRAFGRLPANQREALLLVVEQGLSYEEVAAITGCPLGTAKSRVFRARSDLRAWLLGEQSRAGNVRHDSEARRGGAESRRHPRLATPWVR